MRDNFKIARKLLHSGGVSSRIVAVNGCIYGKDHAPLKRHADRDKWYYKYAGQEFWRFISGDGNLYREIIAPIDKEARHKDETFKAAYAAKVNEMTQDFITHFITDGRIDWIKLVDYVSGQEEVELRPRRKRGQAKNKNLA